MRNVIVHYHIFKNAGMSVDAILSSAVQGETVNIEGWGGRVLRPAQVGEEILASPRAVLFSSHTAVFPVPAVFGVSIFPVVFVRDPIDRVRSMFDFERRQPNPPPATGSLAEYIRYRLDESYPLRSDIANHHTRRFSIGLGHEDPPRLSAALAFMDTLPFIGVVEEFDASMDILLRELGKRFYLNPPKMVVENATPARLGTLGERIEAMRQEIGGELFYRLLEANEDDLKLYDVAYERLLSPSRRAPSAIATPLRDIPGNIQRPAEQSEVSR